MSMTPPFNNQLSQLPVAIYRLDVEDRLIYANTAWLDLHGFKQLEDIVKRSIETIYVRPDEAKRLKEKILLHGFVKDVVVELQKPDGRRFWISINAAATYDSAGEYNGRQGIVTDITESEIHSRIARAIPSGYYVVEIVDNLHKITHCNHEFAQMFGYKTQDEMIGLDISQFYANRDDFETFRKRTQYGREKGIRNRILEVKTRNGRTFDVETNINILRDHMGNDIGRVGVVRDLHNDEPLQKLRRDLGNVLHTFISGLIAVKSDMETAMAAFGKDPFPRKPSIETETLLKEMDFPGKELQRNVATLEKLLDEPGRSEEHTKTAALHTQLQAANYAASSFRPQALRDVAREVIEICQTMLNDHSVPRQPVKQVRQSAFEVMSVYAQSRLHERIGDVLQMEHELRSLYEVLVPANVARNEKKNLKLWTLVEQAMNNLHDFAFNRGVAFKPQPNPDPAHIWANDREIMRVITNLLHNAIKYSWLRQAATWVDIKLYRQNEMVTLEIENFGVPIPEDEIKSKMIFEFGFRSRLATDRGRVGTGIGLADAYKTCQQNGGSIAISSRPAFPGAEAENLEPFLTTVFMTLPISPRRVT